MGPPIVAEKNKNTCRRGAASRRGKSPNWTKDRILRAILRREIEGLPLSPKAVSRQQSGLYQAARGRFGGWHGALRAAGIDPVRVSQNRRWSRRSIIQRIRQLAREGEDLNSAAIQRSEPRLVGAVVRKFASWDEALIAAGVDPQQSRKQRPPWTLDSVIAALRDIHSTGRELNHGALAGGSLTNAAAQLFGSWDGALRAAGFAPEKIRLCRSAWTAESIIEEIRLRHGRGQAVNSYGLNCTSLRNAAYRFFGSWRKALLLAGLDPDKIQKRKPRCKPWTVDTALREIQRKHAAGEALNTNDISPYSLRMSGVKFFGSWDAALTAAGLDPSMIRKKRPPKRSPADAHLVAGPRPSRKTAGGSPSRVTSRKSRVRRKAKRQK